MKKNKTVWLVGSLFIFAAGAFGFYWQNIISRKPPIEVTKISDATPVIEYPVVLSGQSSGAGKSMRNATGTQSTTSARSSQSSEEFLQGIRDLIGQKELEGLLNFNDLIGFFAVTVENATGVRLPGQFSPFKPLEESFRIEKSPEGPVLNPRNFSRYKPYVDLLNSIDSGRLVAIYAQHYSEFQAAYRSLGVKGYFNDRLVMVIDNALAAPEIKGTIRLLPLPYNPYANADLESRSAIQKILIRMGPFNESIVKMKLRQIRKLLVHLNKK